MPIPRRQLERATRCGCGSIASSPPLSSAARSSGSSRSPCCSTRCWMTGCCASTWRFSPISRRDSPTKAGFKPAIVGSIWVIGLTGVLTVPVGIGAAIYLELYAPDNWLTRIIQLNIANLAGVPSIIYGILGLALFVRFMDLGRSVARRCADDVAARAADRHHRVAGGAAGGADIAPRRRAGARRDALADDPGPDSAGRLPRDDDGRHPRPLARHGRDGAADHDRRVPVRAVHARIRRRLARVAHSR